MNKKYWLVVYTPVGKKNIVCGPFENTLDAIMFVSEDFDYLATTIYENLESALADESKMDFVPTYSLK